MAHYKVMATWDEPPNRNVTGWAFTAVPGGNNAAGLPWIQVMREYRIWRNRRNGTITEADVPVDASTQAELDAGTLFDWRWTVQFPTTLTNPQAVAAIEAEINAQEAAMIAQRSAELRYWGFEGDS
jgi:hypothetical protein